MYQAGMAGLNRRESMPFQVFRGWVQRSIWIFSIQGAVTGKLFPTGQVRNMLHVPGIGHIEVSIVDAANPLVFCRCEDFGLSGQELPEQIDTNPELLQRSDACSGRGGNRTGREYRGSHTQRPFSPEDRLCDTATALPSTGWSAP